MKLLLISPDRYKKVKSKTLLRKIHLSPLPLLTLASLTPPEWEVKLKDEKVEEIDFDEEADLVGISAMTADIVRAYEIADKFRERGTKVIFGGVHATVLPEESIKHADSVLIGEAEGIWEKILDDFKRGEIKKFYKNISPPNINSTPPYRIDLLNPQYRYLHLIQTSRGCPHNCAYCSVWRVYGRKVRYRSLENIKKEIENLPKGPFFFADDNFLMNPHSKDVLEICRDLPHHFFIQTDFTTIKRRRELVKFAVKSGARIFFVGLESISPRNLAEINKSFNVVSQYGDMIKIVHDEGGTVMGSFMFGLDRDDENIFPRTLEFCLKSKLDLALFSIFTPFPGTVIFEKMERERRILTYDWAKYDAIHAVFKPMNISIEKLERGVTWLYRKFYSISHVIKRIGSIKKSVLLVLPMNLSFSIFARHRVKEEVGK